MTATLREVGPGRYAVDGELTFKTVQLLAGAAPRATGETSVDLGSVQRVDSAGLALLLEWIEMAREAGGQLVFARLPRQVESLVRVYGLAPLFSLK